MMTSDLVSESRSALLTLRGHLNRFEFGSTVFRVEKGEMMMNLACTNLEKPVALMKRPGPCLNFTWPVAEPFWVHLNRFEFGPTPFRVEKGEMVPHVLFEAFGIVLTLRGTFRSESGEWGAREKSQLWAAGSEGGCPFERCDPFHH